MRKLVLGIISLMMLILPACSNLDAITQKSTTNPQREQAKKEEIKKDKEDSSTEDKENKVEKKQPFCAENECAKIGDEYLAKIRKKHGDFLKVVVNPATSKEYTELFIYKVVDGELRYYKGKKREMTKDDETKAKKIWDLWSSIAPEEQKSIVKEFHLFTSGYLLAEVYRDYDYDRVYWTLGVDIENKYNRKELTRVFIHELGHIITLDESQIPYDGNYIHYLSHKVFEDEVEKIENDCKSFFAKGDGCSLPDSYINQFYQKYWIDIADEWKSLDVSNNEKQLARFYRKHKTKFVTPYAATTPSEDIAETFSYFVLQPKPSNLNTIKNKKIAFFYEYPELVELRAVLLSRIYKEFEG